MLRAASSGNQPIQRDRCSASFAGAFVVMGKNRLGLKERRRSQICHSASKILRCVFKRAWRTLPVRCLLAW